MRQKFFLAAASLLGLLAACGSADKKRVESAPKPTRPVAAEPVPPEQALETLATEVQALQDPGQPFPTAATPKALSAIADLVRSVPVEGAPAVADDLQAALPLLKRNGDAGGRSSKPSAVLRTQLARAVDVVDDHAAVTGELGLQADARTARDDTAALRGDEPLPAQRDGVAQALCSAGRALARASGARIPEALTSCGADLAAASLSEPERTIGGLRDLVHQLALGTWSDAPELVSQLLDELANAIESLAPDSRGEVAIMREMSDRVVDLEEPTLQRVDAIHRGLAAAVAVLERLGSDPQASGWVQSADRAVQSIDTVEPLPLQRPQVQDAFRAVVDALAAIVLLSGEPPS